MAICIHQDVLDYDNVFFPSHILDKELKPIRVFLGFPDSRMVQENEETMYISIFVSDEDYERINHQKGYIFIHNPDITEEDDFSFVDWDEIADVHKVNDGMREHVHLMLDEFKIEDENGNLRFFDQINAENTLH